MPYSTIRSWSLDHPISNAPIDFYLDLTDEAKQAPSLEQAIRRAANILNRVLFPMFQFKVDVQVTLAEKTRHIVVDHSGCQAMLGAQTDREGNKNGYVSCFIGGGWRGDWKTHNVDSIIHELMHTLGRNHEQKQPNSHDLIQYSNSPSKLSAEEFLEYYDPWSPMHYSLYLIKVVLGGEGSVAPKNKILESLSHQGYPPQLAIDYYEALLNLNENNGNFDSFNLGFGLLTQRDFNTLHKTACIIDAKMCVSKPMPPLFAFTANNKISYRYLLKLTKIFVNPWYQSQKLIILKGKQQLQVESNQCYIVKLKDLFSVYPEQQNINCDIQGIALQKSTITQFTNSDFLRKNGDSCTLLLKKELLDRLSQINIAFYAKDRPTAQSSRTLHLLHNNTLSHATLNESFPCIFVPDNKPIYVSYNTTLTPFLNSEALSGSYLDYFERNKYFSRLALNAVPFFAAGLITGFVKRLEIFSYFNENLLDTSTYQRHMTQLIKLFIHIGLTSYAMYQHINEEKARQLLIPLLDENRQLFQTAELMDRLNNEECLSLIIPYAVNSTLLLITRLITPINQHWGSRFGLTNTLAMLLACLANQGNAYSYIELAVGISVYTGGTFIGYCLSGCGLSLLQKLKTHIQFRKLPVFNTPEKNNDIRISLIESEESIHSRDKHLKKTLTVIEAMKCAWNKVSFSKFTNAVSHSSFFNFCNSSEKYEKIDVSNCLRLSEI